MCRNRVTKVLKPENGQANWLQQPENGQYSILQTLTGLMTIVTPKICRDISQRNPHNKIDRYQIECRHKKSSHPVRLAASIITLQNQAFFFRERLCALNGNRYGLTRFLLRLCLACLTFGRLLLAFVQQPDNQSFGKVHPVFCLTENDASGITHHAVINFQATSGG